MITKNETREPRKIHRLYRHDSGAAINYYEGDSKKFQCYNDRTLQLGYGYGATPQEAIEDAIRSLKEFDKEAMIRELEAFAEEMGVSPAEAGSASVAADGGSKVSASPRQVSPADAGSKGPSAGGAVEAADAAAPAREEWTGSGAGAHAERNGGNKNGTDYDSCGN